MDDLVNMSKDERVGETKECQDIKRVRVSQSQRRKGQAKTQSMKSRSMEKQAMSGEITREGFEKVQVH